MINRSILASVAWVIALVGSVGSIFFSEVMQLPPCILCWYQRIAMYPLVVIIAVGIIMRDSRMRNYALPFCIIGLVIAVYHNLVYYGIVPESITPCSSGVPCNSRQLELLGFITIPLMALGAFLSLTLCLWFYKPEQEGK